MELDSILLLRWQFAVTAMFHILWPILTIGLSIILFIIEVLWIKTGQVIYYHQARYWGKILLLNFAVGVVSGIPLAFSFGMNWSPFAHATGDFIGNILGYEASMAFMLEAAFLGIMMFGWHRVAPGIHLFATGMVAFGATLSGFWIMIANSWMHTPAGWVLEDDRIIVKDYFAALFNPSAPTGFLHMWMAAIATSLFVVGGISAWYLLKNRHVEFATKSFRIAVLGVIFVAPLQIVIGDLAGLVVTEHQPAKLAAMEAHWETNPPGDGADWNVIAWPDEKNEKNAWSVQIPDVLSLITKHDMTSPVLGLKEFPPDERPPVAITFWAFRIMVGIGMIMLVIAMWSGWRLLRGQLQAHVITQHRLLLKAWVFAAPLGYIAADSGWVVREVGRQPWTIYGVMKTDAAASALPVEAAASSLISFSLIYILLFLSFLYFGRRMVVKGPDLAAEPPNLHPKDPIHTERGNFDDKRPLEGA